NNPPVVWEIQVTDVLLDLPRCDPVVHHVDDGVEGLPLPHRTIPMAVGRQFIDSRTDFLLSLGKLVLDHCTNIYYAKLRLIVLQSCRNLRMLFTTIACRLQMLSDCIVDLLLPARIDLVES